MRQSLNVLVSTARSEAFLYRLDIIFLLSQLIISLIKLWDFFISLRNFRVHEHFSL